MKKIIDHKKLLYGITIGIILIALLVWGAVRHQQEKASTLLPENKEVTEESADSAGKIMVHVAGAVNAPGVYTLPEGSRVIDAIESAGGLAPDADQDALNLAAVVEDASKITVPNTNSEGTDESGNANGLVNINQADKETLMTLPGIGEVLAQNIINYREKNGGFTSLEELKEVNRIGDKLYEQIADLITL